MNKLIATVAIFALATGVAAEQSEQKMTTETDQISVADNNSGLTYYATINAGESFGNLVGTKSSKINTKNGFAASAYFGVNVNSFFAAELGYLYLPNYKYTDKGTPSHDHKLKNQAIAANIVGKYPLGQGFSAYGKVGAAYVMAKDSGVESHKKNGVVPALGAGIDYALPMVDNLHVQLDYYYLNHKKSDAVNIPTQNVVSIGLRYQF